MSNNTVCLLVLQNNFQLFNENLKKKVFYISARDKDTRFTYISCYTLKLKNVEY